MTQETVRCTQRYRISNFLLWELVKDFYSDWHPVMAWCKEEANQIRHFATTAGGVYKEQLTNYNASDYNYSYTMLEGIENLESYTATLSVTEIVAGFSELTWSATISAPNASAIAQGTKDIFEQGLKAIETIISDKALSTRILLSSTTSTQLAMDMAGKGELCIFLHGIGGNRSNWSNQLLAVAPECKAVALDIRGYGASELSGDGINILLVCKDILQLMEHFESKAVHLVGLSFGSWLAASFADIFTDKVASLTLCAGSTGMSEATQTERDGFAKARLEPTKSGVTPADIADAVVEQISGPHTTANTKALLHKCMTSLPRETYLAALTCFLNPPKKIDFENFNFPTLFIAGEHDKLASPKEMQSVAARIPNSQFVEIPKAGHLINLDCSEIYNHALVNFLKEVMA